MRVRCPRPVPVRAVCVAQNAKCDCLASLKSIQYIALSVGSRRAACARRPARTAHAQRSTRREEAHGRPRHGVDAAHRTKRAHRTPSTAMHPQCRGPHAFAWGKDPPEVGMSGSTRQQAYSARSKHGFSHLTGMHVSGELSELVMRPQRVRASSPLRPLLRWGCRCQGRSVAREPTPPGAPTRLASPRPAAWRQHSHGRAV